MCIGGGGGKLSSFPRESKRLVSSYGHKIHSRKRVEPCSRSQSTRITSVTGPDIVTPYRVLVPTTSLFAS